MNYEEKRNEKIVSLLVLICTLSFRLVSCDSIEYNEALELIENGEYSEAYEILKELGDYKDAQQIIERFHYVPVAATLVEDVATEHIKLFYDETYRPIQIIYTHYDVRESTYDYTYVTNGNLVEEVFTDYYGDKFIKDYGYDANGKNIVKEVDTDSYGNKCTYDYIYGTNRKLIKEVYTDSYGNKCTYDYIYGTNGNLIKEVYTDYYGYKTVKDYTYDENGKIIKEVCTNPNGEKDVCDYTYDANGNKVKEVYTDSNGESYICENTYDANGNLIKKFGVAFYGATESLDIEYKLVYISYDVTEEIEKIIDPLYYY